MTIRCMPSALQRKLRKSTRPRATAARSIGAQDIHASGCSRHTLDPFQAWSEENGTLAFCTRQTIVVAEAISWPIDGLLDHKALRGRDSAAPPERRLA